jgi:hypothetical protein
MSFEIPPGDRMLWEGKPERLRGFLRPIDVFIFFMAIVFGLFVVATISAAGRSDPSGFFVGALFPLVVFGLLFLAPRLIDITRERGRTRYVLTDRRVLIRRGRREIELPLATLSYLELDDSWISGPTIFFAQRQLYEGVGVFGSGSSTPAFRGLRDAPAVYRTISEARTAVSTR